MIIVVAFIPYTALPKVFINTNKKLKLRIAKDAFQTMRKDNQNFNFSAFFLQKLCIYSFEARVIVSTTGECPLAVLQTTACRIQNFHTKRVLQQTLTKPQPSNQTMIHIFIRRKKSKTLRQNLNFFNFFSIFMTNIWIPAVFAFFFIFGLCEWNIAQKHFRK